MTKEKDGDYIEMIWEYTPEFYLVRGWVPEPEARKSMRDFEGDRADEGLVCCQIYAARLQTGLSRSEGWCHEIRIYTEPNRGRFKVTAFLDPAHEWAKAV